MTESYSLSARWIVPIEGQPIPNGRLWVRQGRIERIESGLGRGDIDLGNAAILPGFVNAHTHLELGPLPQTGTTEAEDQIEWLERVIAMRMQTDDATMRSQVAHGVQASLAAGTTTLTDITTIGRSEAALVASPLKAIVFSEILGLKRERALQTSASAYSWLMSPQTEAPERVRRGLSPHAPYSTASWVYEKAATIGVPLATHLAELPEELELLSDNQGRLRTFLEKIGAWDAEWRPVSAHPADYIRRKQLRQADWLVAHGTYIKPSDFWQFRPQSAPAGQRVAVVYCPRTTAWFGHGPHPYRELIQHGGVVCLGTDSLASNPSLSILDEVRFLARIEPDVEPHLLLTMATLSGAWAMRLENKVGSLVPGKAADLAIISLPDQDHPDPYRLVVEGEGSVITTVADGRFVFGPYSA